MNYLQENKSAKRPQKINLNLFLNKKEKETNLAIRLPAILGVFFVLNVFVQLQNNTVAFLIKLLKVFI
jgi:hypothetical protein